MEHAHKLRHDPLRHLQNADSIHMTRVDVATDVANVAVVPDLVERNQHPRDLDAN
jgi:hypothetical protein